MGDLTLKLLLNMFLIQVTHPSLTFHQEVSFLVKIVVLFMLSDGLIA